MKICKMGERCVHGAVLQALSEFYRVEAKDGREYWMGKCRTCVNARTVLHRQNDRARLRLRQAVEQAELRTRKHAALAALSAPLAKAAVQPKIRNELQQKIEQVMARVDTGDSIEFAAWRVGIPVEVVRAWMEAA